MHAPRRTVSAVVLLAAASSGLATPPVLSAAVAAGSFCSATLPAGVTAVSWTGKGDGHSWDGPQNWSSHAVPDAGQTKATYQKVYVCIGEPQGKATAVTIAGGEAFHVAGIDVGQGAHLTVKPGGELFLGSAKGTPTVASAVDKHSQLQLAASTLGGNSPLTVAGTFRWTGRLIGNHKHLAIQASSECVLDPTIPACPGDTSPGGGRTVIAAGGKMRVDGVKFGGVALSGGRVIDNFGTITLTDLGYVSMANRTELIDEAHSSLQLVGEGGIYRTSTHGTSPTIRLLGGTITRHGAGHNLAVVGVPVRYGSVKPAVKVLGGALVLDAARAPKASVHRGTSYGTGTCRSVNSLVCRESIANPSLPQTAVVGASSESAAPAVSKFGVSLSHGPKQVHGHGVLGKQVNVKAPTKKTSHSTHLTLSYDAGTKGLKAGTKPTVYRDHKAVTLCKVHGLTAVNTSCIISATVSRSGAGSKGDLTVVLITIQPNGHWLVAR